MVGVELVSSIQQMGIITQVYPLKQLMRLQLYVLNLVLCLKLTNITRK